MAPRVSGGSRYNLPEDSVACIGAHSRATAGTHGATLHRTCGDLLAKWRNIPMNELKGGCHCGNLSFSLHTNRRPEDFVPRRCSCSMCRRHGASYISDPDAHLDLNYQDVALLSRYRFGHQTAEWIICARCGVLAAVVCEIDGRLRAVVKVQAMLQHVFPGTEVTTDFESETVAERLERRQRNWIGSVSVSPPLP